MLIRGIGPTLEAFGITDTLADPVVTVYAGQKALATNDDWSNGSGAALIAATAQVVGAFAIPNGSKDSAIFLTLPPGAYTVEVAGKNGAQGVAIMFAAFPTASSAYILAARMGGDADSVAAAVSLSILIGMLTLPAWVAWLGA